MTGIYLLSGFDKAYQAPASRKRGMVRQALLDGAFGRFDFDEGLDLYMAGNNTAIFYLHVGGSAPKRHIYYGEFGGPDGETLLRLAELDPAKLARGFDNKYGGGGHSDGDRINLVAGSESGSGKNHYRNYAKRDKAGRIHA